MARLHSSARRLLLPAILVIVVCAATGYLTGNLPETWQNIALPVVAVVIVILGGVAPFIAWASRVHVITTRRVISRSGVFTRTRSEVLHHRSNRLSLRQGPLQALFGSGDITVSVSFPEGREFRIRDIPQVDLVHAALEDLAENASVVPPSTRASEATRRAFDP
ncbi:PH domain-containing protein [Amnibacterium flavum]|uniref:PH domain-containing protein n=1 Tax=Amnibacterium flavum TaxID=2173173 RepID=UPI0014039712|nr:PH domain-containing protein [Amnibacterium flavum]